MPDISSDPEIVAAYDDVRKDKSATNWLIVKYAAATGDAMKLDSTGEGDIIEMAEHLGDDEAAYAYIRQKLGNDEYSERIKFVFVIWAGSQTKVMRRAKMSLHSGDVKKVIKQYAIEIQTADKKDLATDHVVLKLRKAMGANCHFSS
ncbi:MAG: hypothetical protein GOMPHAMPRED_006652 [Gomphillus americanus]|uniref:ADF-H domain-containing protein n=1 Tax=Gomphillus americanus TaxID=1940652 RepID=A0A8H3FXP6_9LECA|nr:MAG: hypothetical protein GOMPHAMPRED_006652 [Gomphillus americanus]